MCSARADISKQVDTLKGLTVSTATTDQIRTSLQAIRADLAKITDAHGDLSGQRKQQIPANQAFSSQVKSIASKLGTSLSLSSAQGAAHRRATAARIVPADPGPHRLRQLTPAGRLRRPEGERRFSTVARPCLVRHDDPA